MTKTRPTISLLVASHPVINFNLTMACFFQDDCLQRSVQTRNRSVVRNNDNCDKKDDGHLAEKRPCAENCFFRYEWALTAWSSCQPVGDSSCGEGKRKRGARCIRLRDGRPVKDSMCDLKVRPRGGELETWCPIDCPIDCEVSAWSRWDDSGCKCGRKSETNMTRTRVVVTEASPTGRPCPSVMTETLPCPSRPCYSWVRSGWVCDLQGASCGHGLARRNVTCFRSSHPGGGDGGGPVGHQELVSFCRDHHGDEDSNEVDGCLKSCATDCSVSEWSAWSQCHGKCVTVKTSECNVHSSDNLIIY